MERMQPLPARPGAASSQGVDLHELERLRMLVRFEFDDKLSRDQLIAALLQCHNNTREAYHLLKEQRREEELAMAAEEAARQDHTALAAQATNTNNANGLKRPSDNTDTAMNATTKRHRSESENIDVDLSQDDDEVMVIDATQPVNTAPPPAPAPDLERANQLLTAVVRDVFLDRNSMAADRWIPEVAEALAVTLGGDVDGRLAGVVDALAKSLQQLNPSDVPAVLADGVDQILRVLRILSSLDQHEVVMEMHPSDAELHRHTEHSANAYARATDAALNVAQQSDAARTAISVLTDACARFLARKESIRKFETEMVTSRQKARAHVDDRNTRIKKDLQDAKVFVEDSERELQQVRVECAKATAAQKTLLTQFRDALIEEGVDEHLADGESIVRMMESTTDEARVVLHARSASFAAFLDRKKDVMQANLRLVFFQRLHSLLHAIKPRVEEWLRASSTRAKQVKTHAICEVEDKLRLFVPQLTHMLGVYYDFQSLRQRSASEDIKKLEREIEGHNMLYGNLVQMTVRAKQDSINEYRAAIMHFTQQMREVAALQSDLWRGKQALFTSEFFATIEGEYQKLWSRLDGGARDMMHDCVAAIMSVQSVDRGEAARHTVQVSANTETEASVAPFQFVARVEGTPTAEPACSKPTSPVVDLTGDDDEDMGDKESWESVTPPVQIKVEQLELPSAHFVSATSWRDEEVPQVPESQPFSVGMTLYARVRPDVDDDDDDVPFFRGVVKEVRGDGKFLIVYDNGDEFTTDREFLYTPEQMKAILHPHPPSDEQGSSGCIVM